jgi:DNA-binding SARP family transcriptional activator/basic membrane lipoprotein Med (substrate-binding protein (PBP1-ABC) superfamily)
VRHGDSCRDRGLQLTTRTRGQELHFQLLGPLSVRAGLIEIGLGSPKQRSVLAVLLLHANEVVPTDRIIDFVWGESPPRTAEHSVQIYISKLRRALANGSATDVIDTRPPGYVINVAPDTVDTLRFERLVREGLAAIREGDAARGRPKLLEALDSWTGDPLADFVYEDFAQGYIRSLAELHSDALEALAVLDLEMGDVDAARDRARAAIEGDPLREGPRRVMMVALYRTGRQAEALRHYGSYKELLADELGIDPSEAMRRLEEQILLQDPGLAGAEKPVSTGNPYRGLRAFSEDDADVYFGRESLVADVLARLLSGPGFVSIVGPSGSGKSSAARAGVTPELRKRGDTVVVFQPGSRPLWELARALDLAGLGSQGTLLRRFENDPEALRDVVTRPLVLIVDQFEELFTLTDHDVAVRFSELISAAVRDHETPLRVVATLRADYYDRPLSMPALAGVFSDSVVSVKPMTPQEIERAVVEPARAVGVGVEPALLAQLVGDMGDAPGALPLLQFTLFEMFEESENGLTLDGYRDLGGINGALTGGADRLLAELDPDGREVAEQLMMRMVRRGRALNTSKPVSLRDLVDLRVDSVELQGVLEGFGARRLITFDRDASGGAVVEMAHECLISEWPQMEEWLEEHAEDLERLGSLQTATADWLAADGSDDYLLRGDRLDRFESWWSVTSLRLTKIEADFINSSMSLRDRQQQVEKDRRAKEATLQRRARRRLWYLGGAIAAFTAAVTLLVVTLVPDPPPDVVARYCCRGDGGFGDRIANGLDAGIEGTGLNIQELGPNPSDRAVLWDYAAAGTGLVITDGLLDFDQIEGLLAENPALVIGYIECSDQGLEQPERLWCVAPANHEMGFLAGAAAGLTTESDRVGIILGVDTFNMPAFQSGFEQGVHMTNPDATVDAVYLSGFWPYEDTSGFGSVALARITASEMYEAGSDVIFAAAGRSNKGVHEAAADFTDTTGVQVWTIGADEDEWSFYDGEWWPEWTDEKRIGHLSERSSRIQEHILTSVEKRSNVGIANLIQAYARGETQDHFELNVANGAIGYSFSGEHLKAIRDELDGIVEDVATGRIVVSFGPVVGAPFVWEWLEQSDVP